MKETKSRGTDARKRIPATTENANISINQMAFGAGLCMTRQSSLAADTAKALFRYRVAGQGSVRALQQAGCILSQTTEKQEGGMGREEEKSPNENPAIAVEYKMLMSKWTE